MKGRSLELTWPVAIPANPCPDSDEKTDATVSIAELPLTLAGPRVKVVPPLPVSAGMTKLAGNCRAGAANSTPAGADTGAVTAWENACVGTNSETEGAVVGGETTNDTSWAADTNDCGETSGDT